MHNIEYFTYDENVKRDYVQKELDQYAAMEDWKEGCTGLGSDIRWLENIGICKDYEEAVQAIKDHDRKWYDQLAVRYYEPSQRYSDKHVQELRGKELAALAAYLANDNVWATGLKAEFVGCKNCGSKLKREFIHTNYCPVCRKDLRPESTLKTVYAAKERYEKARKATEAYINTHAAKKVKWLVKIEYHT